MGKTYKTQAINFYLRRMSGRKQAIINNARPGAIPPNSWDDYVPDAQCVMCWSIADDLKEQGYSREQAAKKIAYRFKMSYMDAWYVTSRAYWVPHQ